MNVTHRKTKTSLKEVTKCHGSAVESVLLAPFVGENTKDLCNPPKMCAEARSWISGPSQPDSRLRVSIARVGRA